MPIITKPATIEKNVSASISLDKSALAAVTSVAADSYFSDSANWSRVHIYYKSSVGNQREMLRFDATQASPSTNFLVSEKARDIFQVEKILILDFDNGSFEVPRSQLTVAEFDIDTGAVPGPEVLLTTQNGSITFAALGQSKTNDFEFNTGTPMGWAFGVSPVPTFSYSTPAPGMTSPGTYRVRYYYSSLVITDNDAVFKIQGFDTPIQKTKAQVESEYAQNGYIEFQYLINPSTGISVATYAPTSNSITYTISKIEILSI